MSTLAVALKVLPPHRLFELVFRVLEVRVETKVALDVLFDVL